MEVDAREFRHALQRVCDIFKVPWLYSEQEKCLEALFKGKDIYASLPTGYRKSLIIYAAPIAADELFLWPHGSSKIVVISPLRTLIEDQVAYLRSLELSAIALYNEESEERLKEVENGAFAYFFASPEKMLSVERWRKLLLTKQYQKLLVAITVDEAHCISQWGLLGSSSKHTAVPFRIWYGNMGELQIMSPLSFWQPPLHCQLKETFLGPWI